MIMPYRFFLIANIRGTNSQLFRAREVVMEDRDEELFELRWNIFQSWSLIFLRNLLIHLH